MALVLRQKNWNLGWGEVLTNLGLTDSLEVFLPGGQETFIPRDRPGDPPPGYFKHGTYPSGVEYVVIDGVKWPDLRKKT